MIDLDQKHADIAKAMTDKEIGEKIARIQRTANGYKSCQDGSYEASLCSDRYWIYAQELERRSK